MAQPGATDPVLGRFNLPAGQYPVQALEPGASVTLAIGVATANVALVAGAAIIRIGNDVDMYLAFGTGSVTVDTTDDIFVAAGAEFFVVPLGATHVAVISSDGATTGKASFTEMKAR